MKNIIDLHTHTIASGHAYSTLMENIKAAKEKGILVLGVSDHAPGLPGSTHEFYFSNLKVIPNFIEEIRILKGAEVNILSLDGDIDLDERTLSFLDYTIASLHVPCINNHGKDLNTSAVINAMNHKKVKIIGHPDDSRLPMDYERLVMAAKEKGVLLEVNNSSLTPLAFRKNARENYIEMLNLCKIYDVEVIIGSDCHFMMDIGNFDLALELMKEIEFPLSQVVNFNHHEIWKNW